MNVPWLLILVCNEFNIFSMISFCINVGSGNWFIMILGEIETKLKYPVR